MLLSQKKNESLLNKKYKIQNPVPSTIPFDWVTKKVQVARTHIYTFSHIQKPRKMESLILLHDNPKHQEIFAACLLNDRTLLNSILNSVEEQPPSQRLLDCALCGACRGGHRDLVDELIERGATNFSQGASNVYVDEHPELYKYLIGKTNNFRECLQLAFETDNVDLIAFAIEQDTKSWERITLSKSATFPHINWNCALFGACKNGKIENVLMVIEKGSAILDWNWGLAGACYGGHQKVINLMIAKGARDFLLALKYALNGAQNGAHNNAIIESMSLRAMQHGHSKKSILNTHLQSACSTGNFPIIKKLVELGANNFCSALYLICRHKGDQVIEYVDFLIEKALDSDSTLLRSLLNNGLHTACKYSNYEIFNHLTTKHHVVITQDLTQFLKHALDGACTGNNIDTVLQLFKHIEHNSIIFDYDNLLFLACYSGCNRTIINIILDKGVKDINKGLYGACVSGSRDTVLFMIEKGADDWKTAMQFTCTGTGNFDLLEMILQRFTPTLEDFDFILINAAKHGLYVLVDYAIAHGATKFNTAFEHSNSCGDFEMVKYIWRKANQFKNPIHVWSIRNMLSTSYETFNTSILRMMIALSDINNHFRFTEDTMVRAKNNADFNKVAFVLYNMKKFGWKTTLAIQKIKDNNLALTTYLTNIHLIDNKKSKPKTTFNVMAHFVYSDVVNFTVRFAGFHALNEKS